MSSRSGSTSTPSLRTMTQQLQELDDTLNKLYRAVELSPSPHPIIQKLIAERETLLIRGTAATQLLEALKTQKEDLSSTFYKRKRKHLMEELRQIHEALSSQTQDVTQILRKETT